MSPRPVLLMIGLLIIFTPLHGSDVTDSKEKAESGQAVSGGPGAENRSVRFSVRLMELSPRAYELVCDQYFQAADTDDWHIVMGLNRASFRYLTDEALQVLLGKLAKRQDNLTKSNSELPVLVGYSASTLTNGHNLKLTAKEFRGSDVNTAIHLFWSPPCDADLDVAPSTVEIVRSAVLDRDHWLVGLCGPVTAPPIFPKNVDGNERRRGAWVLLCIKAVPQAMLAPDRIRPIPGFEVPHPTLEIPAH